MLSQEKENTQREEGIRMREKTYESCTICKKKMYSYKYNSMCGKCYLVWKQEQREKKGLK